MEAALAANAGGLGAELSDVALVGLYRDGAGDFAYGELIRRHQIGVFRVLLAMLGDADEAERACEQVFFEGSRKLDELEDPANFYQFMLAQARAYVQKQEQNKQSRAAPAKPRPPPKNPRAAVKRQVQTVLRELDNDERVALMLAHLEGDSYESIGATLGRSALEAEEMVARAQEKFVEALTRGSEPSPEEAKEAPAPAELAEGSMLGQRYRIETLVGAGGMGAVYKATDVERDALVAIKTLLPAAAKDPTLRRRFEREAEVIRRLTHPNFVEFVEYGGNPASGEPLYVVMEYVDGKPLSRVLSIETQLLPKRALHVVEHILRGLSWAHEHGVVHRDIKPSNVMLVQHEADPDFAKILDLGIARVLGNDGVDRTRLTKKDEIFGTPVYMSPEQVRGEDVDGRSDLYSLSVLLFELLAARPPFEAKNSMALFAMHLASVAPALHEVAPELRVPRALQRLLDRGLEKEPAARFASAQEFLAELERVLGADFENVEPPEPRPAGFQGTTAPAVKRVPQALAGAPRPRTGARLIVRLRKIPLSLALLLTALVVFAIWQGYRWVSHHP
ncbi:MAG: protein kinase [Polyangiaceae bacterium]